jgi:hypothetical protein
MVQPGLSAMERRLTPMSGVWLLQRDDTVTPSERDERCAAGAAS